MGLDSFTGRFQVSRDKLSPRDVEAVVSVEMSLGQQVEDVQLSVLGRVPVHFWGRTGGVVPTPDETAEAIRKFL